MENKKKYPKKRVWEKGSHETEAQIRYVIAENPDGSCIAVCLNAEAKYERCGVVENTAHWDHYADIQEKKTRPMTSAEVFKSLEQGAILRDQNGHVFNCFFDKWEISEWTICYDFTGHESDLWESLEVDCE